MELQPPGEVLGEMEDWNEPLADRLWQALRRHPIALAAIIIVALVLAGSAAAVFIVQGPELATVTVQPAASQAAAQPDESSPSVEPPWRPGVDGRPGPVVLTLSANVHRTGPGAPTSVVEVTGPGIVAAHSQAVLLPAGGPDGRGRGAPVTVPFRAAIDCRTLPSQIAAGAYGLRIRAKSRSGTKYAVAPAGAVGDGWATAIRRACASWAARRDLTVTALSAQVHPTQPRLDLSLTVTNSGDREAALSSVRWPWSAVRSPVHLEGAVPRRVPPHGSVKLRLTAVVDRCDSVSGSGVPGARDQTSPLNSDSGLSDQFNLRALIDGGVGGGVGAGIDDAGAGTVSGYPIGYNEGFEPTGIVIVPAAQPALAAALDTACAGLGPMLSLISPGSLRYDPPSRDLTVRVIIDVEPGRVRAMRLQTQSQAPFGAPLPEQDGESTAYRPLWKTVRNLEPDRSGQVRVTLRYRAPRTGPCPERGGYMPVTLPGFLATLTAPVAGVDRVVTYQGVLSLGDDPQAAKELCGR